MRLRPKRIYSRIRRRTNGLHKGVEVIPLMVLALLFLTLSLSGYRYLLTEGGFDHSLAKSLLHFGMPSTGLVAEQAEGQLGLGSFVHWLTNYDLRDPLGFMETVLHRAAPGFVQFQTWEERPFVFIQELSFAPDPVRPFVEPDQKPGSDLRSDPRSNLRSVLIYHTHSSEMYLGRAVNAAQSSQGHYPFRNLADPTITGVMAVGRHLSNALNSLGVKTVHDTHIHTFPNINNSYANSEKTVREILSKQKDFDIVIDLHRDAGVPNPTISVDGRQVGRMVLVVGTAEKIPLAHPNFQDNLAFAYKIKRVCDEMYPGLMRPVQVQKEARYNQHLHPQSLIVELGSVENTLEEALLAAELLASVLARVFTP